MRSVNLDESESTLIRNFIEERWADFVACGEGMGYTEEELENLADKLSN